MIFGARVRMYVYDGNGTKATTNDETVVISIGEGWRRDASAVAQTNTYVSWTIDTCEDTDWILRMDDPFNFVRFQKWDRSSIIPKYM